MRNSIFIFTLIFLNVLAGYAQNTWEVPEDNKSVQNPLPVSIEVIEKGEGIYEARCKSCHGEPGKGNNLPLNPIPTDPGSDGFQGMTDGEIFYKAWEGRGAMPAFKNQVSGEDTWSVLRYLRTFGKAEQVMATAGVEETPAFSGTKAELTVAIDEQLQTVTAIVKAENEAGQMVPLKGERVVFAVKRLFGDLPIGSPIKTDNDGVAKVDFPHDLPANEAGKVELIVKLKDEQKYGVVVDSLKATLGQATHPKNMMKERSLFNKSQKAPIWLLMAYLGVVGGVWLTIAYVALMIKKIKEEGDKA